MLQHRSGQETGTFSGATTSNTQFIHVTGGHFKAFTTWTGQCPTPPGTGSPDGPRRRTVRLMIEHERRAGVPVLSDNSKGYFLPETDQETVACVRSLRHRAGEILRTAAALERTVPQELVGQITLDNCQMEVFNE